jgi:hypothetical protein
MLQAAAQPQRFAGLANGVEEVHQTRNKNPDILKQQNLNECMSSQQ